ncbi:glycosyltransferase family 4 protein [Pseudoflavonifractor phocaeensis]|uniref:glycosyltransferase family 4 protein n=1 Tax=Pseudoflavonifractor phocaeensis TaxID=1870988 RepID=UPI00195DE916|nr:glycosyltransferase family 4 protein [Pseudoflavonifractor phocaeensis]MBM6937444.1 glycosyltransferase family 4 protein [Pseudoflavonifractor phocaeensis]
MKKVLFVATVVQLHIARFHIPYLKWFHEQGWQVDVAAKNDYAHPEECVIPYCDHFYDIPFARSPFDSSNLRAFKMLKQRLDETHYDIIHCHTPMGAVIARLAARKSRRAGTKVIYTAHGFHFYRGAPMKNWLLYYPAERFLARWTDVILTMNREDEQAAHKFPCPRIEYVPGVGIDLEKFSRHQPRDAVRAALGIPPDAVFILSVGELIARKNYNVAIEAVAALDTPADFRFYIAGIGDKESQLRQHIADKGLEDKIKLLGFRSDIPDLLHAADVFFFPSLQEGLPVAVMEAMACGLPIVCSRIRGNTDLIDEGLGGYLVDAADTAGFTQALTQCITSSSNADMAAYNREKIVGFSEEAVLERMANIYRTTMNGAV